MRPAVGLGCVVIGVLTLIARPSDACDQARYTRLLPLGRAGGDLVALELRQLRRPEDGSWSISPRLIAMEGADGPLRLRREVEPFPAIHTPKDMAAYLKAVKPVLARALARARTLPGFEEATLRQHWDCDYSRSCDGYRLRPKGDWLELTVGHGRSAVTVPVPAHAGGSEAPAVDAWRLAGVKMLEAGGETYALISMSSGSLEHSVCAGGDASCPSDRRPAMRPSSPGISTSLTAQAPLWHGDDFDFLIKLHPGSAAAARRPTEIAGVRGGPPIQTTCPSMPHPTQVPELVGKTYQNAARRLPQGLVMEMEAGVGDRGWSVVSTRRGTSLIVLVSRLSSREPEQTRIVQAIDLGTPCAGLEIETLTCAVNGRRSTRVFALMDDGYRCGGHGESAPVRAWRLTKDRAIEIDPRRVTCGSDSCEVDPPPFEP